MERNMEEPQRTLHFQDHVTSNITSKYILCSWPYRKPHDINLHFMRNHVKTCRWRCCTVVAGETACSDQALTILQNKDQNFTEVSKLCLFFYYYRYVTELQTFKYIITCYLTTLSRYHVRKGFVLALCRTEWEKKVIYIEWEYMLAWC
jgi:hypothetical protein